jgi:hypothetical protein
MAGNRYARRLAQLESHLRCPRHYTWLYCFCDDIVDIDRLTDAEGDLLLRLAEKADAFARPPTYTPCAACGEARHCLICDGEAMEPGLQQLTAAEQEALAHLLAKGLIEGEAYAWIRGS